MRNKLCLIYNMAPVYREAIFKAIDNEYDCDWYFSKTKTDIKGMDLSLLKNTFSYNTCGNSNFLYWKSGVIGLLFSKKYHTYFMIAESRSLTDYLFIGISRLLNKSVYVWTHGMYGKENFFELLLKKWQFRHVDGIFVYSNYSRNLMIDQGIPAENIFTIHNSLNYDQQKEIRDNLSPSHIYRHYFGNAYPTIIFIGRLTKVKNLDMLIEALAKLKYKNEFYNLVFIGDGTEKGYLREKVVEYGVQNNVWFYGACYDEMKNAELIYNADLCVSPGNIGLTAMHVLVYGCPIITHNSFEMQMPEFESVRPGKTGDFFEKGNISSLMDAISNWFANNRNKREDVRNACYYEIDSQWNPYIQMQVLKNNLKFIQK